MADPIHDLITAERARLGALLPDLTADEWAGPSLCSGWTTRDVVGHLVVSMTADRLRFLIGITKALGNFDRATDHAARAQAQRSTDELIAAYRAAAARINPPPFLGPCAPLTDVVVHTQDIVRPLGRTVAPDPVRTALEFRTTNRLAGSFGGAVPPDTTLIATDLAWRHVAGSGAAVVEAPGIDLLLLVSGRPIDA